MADVNLSPNMGLPVPIVGVDSGPNWANNINDCLSILDSHTHVPGSGAQLTSDSLYIGSDLPFNSNNATLLRSTRFIANNSPLADPTDLGCVYQSGVDLYYNDGNGNQIRITQAGSIAGTPGSITGLPSGTASAAFSGGQGTFIFEQSTSTAANMDAGTLIVRYPGSYPAPAGNYIALQAPNTLATGYAFTLPATLPAANNSFVASSNAGALSYITTDNSTLEVSGTNIRIKDLGVTKPKLAPLGQQTGTQSANFISSVVSLTAVPGLSVTITTTGRPVMIVWAQSGTTSGWININSSGTVQILRGANIVLHTYYGVISAMSVPANLTTIDTPVAGTYTYTIKATTNTGGSNFEIYRTKLVVYEL